MYVEELQPLWEKSICELVQVLSLDIFSIHYSQVEHKILNEKIY